jgi:hypothetical protein
MGRAFILSIAVGLALAAPVAAQTRTSAHRAIHHWSAMTKATALAPRIAAVPWPPSRDSDGLSRHASDCNMGCIDH